MKVSVWIDLDLGTRDGEAKAYVNPANETGGNRFMVVGAGDDVTIVGKNASKFRALGEAMLRVAAEFETVMSCGTCHGTGLDGEGWDCPESHNPGETHGG
ncbi:hypothetical protein LCGC14_2606620 [marine sediment metagenome]|uniref:Uncharacterized protein n=1 Tax=marine sediment metagenome TaxID=412755 RepID=A0A0F9AUU6_9ZZZZ